MNGFDWMIPLTVSRQITIPLIPELDVTRASVHRAPLTFHCFFSAPHQELPSGWFDYVRDLTVPYQGATSITCQTLHSKQRYQTFVIWVRYADDGDDGDDGADGGEARKKEELLNLPAPENAGELVFDDERDISVAHTGEARRIVAAVLMIQPRGWHECKLIGPKASDAPRTFHAEQPISGFVMPVKAISCYKSDEEGREQETHVLGSIR